MRNFSKQIGMCFDIIFEWLNMVFNTFLVGFWTAVWHNNQGYVGGAYNDLYMDLEDYLKQQIEDYE